MRVVGVTTFGEADVLQVLQVPQPHVGAGEVRIRVHAVAVNPTDVLLRTGVVAARLAYQQLPYIPGMDLAGIIDEIGPEADGRLKIGDRVIALVVPTDPRKGAYAEHVVVAQASVVPMPTGVDFAPACTLLMNAMTARVALDALGLCPGETLGVTGAAGTLGLTRSNSRSSKVCGSLRMRPLRTGRW
jgi:NADPH2:quinone reductase